MFLRPFFCLLKIYPAILVVDRCNTPVTSIDKFCILCDMKSLSILDITNSWNFTVFDSRTLIEFLTSVLGVSFDIVICIIIHIVTSCDIQFGIYCFLAGLCRLTVIERHVSMHAMVFCIAPGSVILLILCLALDM
jgi:hypothetical protein